MEPQNDQPKQGNSSHRVILGMIAVFIGVVLIAANFGYIPYHWKNIFFSWEMILIVIGIVMIAKQDGKPAGYILLGVGGFFLIPDIFYFSFDFVDLFWPLVIIFAGIALIAFNRNKLNVPGLSNEDDRKRADHLKAGYIDEMNFFGGSNRKYHHQEFKGGKVTSIFGGSEIDLTQAKLAEGTSTIEVTFIFGGSTLIVPSDWNVVLDITSIFGGFKDARVLINKPEEYSSKGVLIVKGVAIFGGGEIKSY